MKNKSDVQRTKNIKAKEAPANTHQLYGGISLDKRYELIREQINHEDELINQRLNWLLLSQGFLFAALTALLTADPTKITVDLNTLHWIKVGIPVTGLLFNLFSFSGLDAAYQSLKYLRKNWTNYLLTSPEDGEYHNSFPQITWRKPAITTASGTPIVISIVWLLLFFAINNMVLLNWMIGIIFGCCLVWMFYSTIQNRR